MIEENINRKTALKWWSDLSKALRFGYWTEYCDKVFSPSTRPQNLTGREIEAIWQTKTGGTHVATNQYCSCGDPSCTRYNPVFENKDYYYDDRVFVGLSTSFEVMSKSWLQRLLACKSLLIYGEHPWQDGQELKKGVDYNLSDGVNSTKLSKVFAFPCISLSIPDKQPDENILCAATWYKEQPTAGLLPINIDKGVVLCGYRHGDINHQLLALTGLTSDSLEPECGEYEQGFLTNTNRFVGRKEAYGIAFKAEQIIGPNKGHSENDIGLTSEDLY
jgi:hypothetical protein